MNLINLISKSPNRAIYKYAGMGYLATVLTMAMIFFHSSSEVGFYGFLKVVSTLTLMSLPSFLFTTVLVAWLMGPIIHYKSKNGTAVGVSLLSAFMVSFLTSFFIPTVISITNLVFSPFLGHLNNESYLDSLNNFLTYSLLFAGVGCIYGFPFVLLFGFLLGRSQNGLNKQRSTDDLTQPRSLSQIANSSEII